jgi:hypothetical protein
MSDFRDMVGEMPDSPKRIGYAAAVPPVMPQAAARPPMRMKVK